MPLNRGFISGLYPGVDKASTGNLTLWNKAKSGNRLLIFVAQRTRAGESEWMIILLQTNEALVSASAPNALMR